MMNSEILNEYVIIPGYPNDIKVRDLIKEPITHYIKGNKSKEFLINLEKKLSENNLVFGMNDFDLELYKLNIYSIFLTIKLEDFLGKRIFGLLKKRGIYTISQLVLIDEKKFMESKTTGLGFAKTLSSKDLTYIKDKLSSINLKLNMSKEEILEIVKIELIKRFTETIKKENYKLKNK